MTGVDETKRILRKWKPDPNIKQIVDLALEVRVLRREQPLDADELRPKFWAFMMELSRALDV